MASLSPGCAWIHAPVRRTPRSSASASASASDGVAVDSDSKQVRRRRVTVVAGGLGNVAEVVRKDVEFLKDKIGGGLRWENVPFRIPEAMKKVEEVFWLRNLEDPAAPPLDPQSWPQPSYPGLSGVDLLMADVKALEAYVGYFYYLSKLWSRPLPEFYEPDVVADYFSCRPHVVAFRLLEVFFAFMFAAIRIQTSVSDKGTKVEASGKIFGMVLKETMLNLGPTFIKVGQSLSTRPDIIGTEVSKALSDLHEQVPPFSRPQAMKIIEEELGAAVESCFSYISEETIAAASFGQVYRGRTIDGSDVAVKVQRPNLRHSVLRDIYILRLGLGVLRKIAKRKSDIRLYADELGKGFAGELDYTLEATNASEFLEAHSRFPYIRVPKVYRHLTRKRVLTMEWIVGESPADLLSLSSGDVDYNFQYPEEQKYEAQRRLLDLVSKGVEATLVQLLETGLLHADPHPGNLRYTSSGQIGFLDFGLVCRMQKKHQFAMLASIVHIVNGDWASLVQALSEMDVIKPGTNTRRITMDLEDTMAEVELKDGIPAIKFSKVLGKIVSVALNHQFRMPPYFTLVLRSLASFEGLAAAGDPNFKTFEAAYPFVVQKLLTENSPATRKILHSVVLTRRKEFRWERLSLFLNKSSTRKRLQSVASSSQGSSVDIAVNRTNSDVDIASLVLKLLTSKDGVVLRRLVMTANGSSLIQTFVSRESHNFRQQLCRTIANMLYRWMLHIAGFRSPKLVFPIDQSSGVNSSTHDLGSLVSDKRLRVIIRKILDSSRNNRILMFRLCWTSSAVLLTATALACYRFIVSVSESYVDYLSLATKKVALRT